MKFTKHNKSYLTLRSLLMNLTDINQENSSEQQPYITRIPWDPWYRQTHPWLFAPSEDSDQLVFLFSMIKPVSSSLDSPEFKVKLTTKAHTRSSRIGVFCESRYAMTGLRGTQLQMKTKNNKKNLSYAKQIFDLVLAFMALSTSSYWINS